MVYPVHHVPGRLRVRILPIKGHPDKARLFAARMEALPGVRAVAANALTGSVVIHYDARLTSDSKMLAALGVETLTPAAAGSARLLTPMARRICRSLAQAVMERALERGALALIGALI
jgi:Heavy metal associated domain 2